MQCERQLFRPTTVVLFILVAATLLMFVHGAAIPRDFEEKLEEVLDKSKMAVDHPEKAESHDKTEQTQCLNNPCGWAVYDQFTRSIDYFMKNSCVCPENRQCLQSGEDVSIAAFVYHCR